MALFDRIRHWWSPGEGQEDHPLTDEEREQRTQLEIDAPDEHVDPQHGVGAESWDRIDVERDLRKPE